MEHSFDYKKYPRKINLGCGFDHKQEYLNVDALDGHKPDLIADVRNLSMLPSDYYEYLYANDVLEHIPRNEFKSTLAEWFRLLVPGGSIYIKTTSIINLAELFKHSYYLDPENEERLIKCLFGTQAYEGDFHLCGFTASYLEYCMRKIGFTQISIAIVNHWLLSVNAIKGDGQNVPEIIYSYGFFNVENEENGLRWSQCESEIITYHASKLSLTVDFPKYERNVKKKLFYSVNGNLPVSVKLNKSKPTNIEIDLPAERARVKFETNYVYTPYLLDSSNTDQRKLSFTVSDVKINK